MRIAAGLVFSMSLILPACSGDKAQPAQKTATTSCETNTDCNGGWICLDGECASASQKTRVTEPGNAVTPDKVKREIEKRTEQGRERADDALAL